MKIVSNGHYFMIRRFWWPFYQYASLVSVDTWFPNDHIDTCLGSLEEVISMYQKINRRNGKFKPLKVKKENKNENR